jgi:hypothetical protein
MGRYADLLDEPPRADYDLRPNDKNDKSPPMVVSVVTTKTTKDPFGRFGRLVVCRSEPFAQTEYTGCTKSEVSAKSLSQPASASGYGRTAPGLKEAFEALERRCPDHVEPRRWQQAVEDGRWFLAVWGEQADALGWTVEDLFGLHKPPAKPHPSYNRLSRYDATGLVWLLAGRRVTALTTRSAAVEAQSGAAVTYRRHYKPALGPLGDGLADMDTGASDE